MKTQVKKLFGVSFLSFRLAVFYFGSICYLVSNVQLFRQISTPNSIEQKRQHWLASKHLQRVALFVFLHKFQFEASSLTFLDNVQKCPWIYSSTFINSLWHDNNSYAKRMCVNVNTILFLTTFFDHNVYRVAKMLWVTNYAMLCTARTRNSYLCRCWIFIFCFLSFLFSPFIPNSECMFIIFRAKVNICNWPKARQNLIIFHSYYT